MMIFPSKSWNEQIFCLKFSSATPFLGPGDPSGVPTHWLGNPDVASNLFPWITYAICWRICLVLFYFQGCYDIVIDFLESKFLIIAGCAFGFAFFQVRNQLCSNRTTIRIKSKALAALFFIPIVVLFEDIPVKILPIDNLWGMDDHRVEAMFMETKPLYSLCSSLSVQCGQRVVPVAHPFQFLLCVPTLFLNKVGTHHKNWKGLKSLIAKTNYS